MKNHERRNNKNTKKPRETFSLSAGCYDPPKEGHRQAFTSRFTSEILPSRFGLVFLSLIGGHKARLAGSEFPGNLGLSVIWPVLRVQTIPRFPRKRIQFGDASHLGLTTYGSVSLDRWSKMGWEGGVRGSGNESFPTPSQLRGCACKIRFPA